MNRRTLAIAILIPFTLLTLYAVSQVGFIGIFEYHLHSPAGWQVIADLVIALVLVLTWLVPEARTSACNLLRASRSADSLVLIKFPIP